jgi:hypothetical protein
VEYLARNFPDGDCAWLLSPRSRSPAESGVSPKAIRREMRHRAAIEPVVARPKNDHRGPGSGNAVAIRAAVLAALT